MTRALWVFKSENFNWPILTLKFYHNKVQVLTTALLAFYWLTFCFLSMQMFSLGYCQVKCMLFWVDNLTPFRYKCDKLKLWKPHWGPRFSAIHNKVGSKLLLKIFQQKKSSSEIKSINLCIVSPTLYPTTKISIYLYHLGKPPKSILPTSSNYGKTQFENKLLLITETETLL